MVILERRDVLGFSSLSRQCNSDSRNGATSSFFHKCATFTEIHPNFSEHCVLWQKKGVAPLRELLYNGFFSGDIIWGSIPHRTEFQGSPITVDFLDSVTSELFRLGLGASDC